MEASPRPTQPYLYQSITPDEIRLLEVHAGQPGDPLKCSLRQILLPVDDTTPYETVSYCWGNIPDRTSITVDCATLQVPTSAVEALRRLRYLAGTRVIWIDSICIDQSNVAERGHQVANMHSIYKLATQNLIWLGEDDGTVSEALSNVDILFEHARQATNNFETFPIAGGENTVLHAKTGISVAFDPEPVLRLLERPWFSRLWVVQEAGLAKYNLCLCGPYTFELTRPLRAAKWLWTKRPHIHLHQDTDESFRRVRRAMAMAIILQDVADLDLGWYSIASRMGWFRERRDTAPFFALLDSTARFACREPVDHVYGILGLWRRFAEFDELLPDLLQPDYDRPTADVFRDAARFAMSEAGSLASLQLLHHRVDDPTTNLSFPSWVPPWYRDYDTQLDPTPLQRGYNAHDEWMCDTFDSLSGDPDSIMLEGIFLDSQDDARIDAVSEPLLDKLTIPDFVATAFTMVATHSRARSIANIQIALATTLVAAENAERGVATEDDLRGLVDVRNHFWSAGKRAPTIQMLRQLEASGNTSAETRRACRYAEACLRMCYRRRFFVTAGGRVGLGPQTAQVGDVVGILYGGEWPFILRQNDRGDKYEMIGSSFLYDVMKGEAVRAHIATFGEEADELFIIT